jgi:chemotaxis protein CheY-P-specific phosphatase CheC
MKTITGDAFEAQRERMRALARIGADCATSAFATMLGADLVAGDTRVYAWRGTDARDPAGTGVFFEMEGIVEGLIGFFLRPSAGESLVRAQLPHPDPPADIVESVLREAANIVASHAVSGIADFLGGRITLSIPILVLEDAGGVFSRLLTERGDGRVVVATESELRDPRSEVLAHLILAPDAP